MLSVPTSSPHREQMAPEPWTTPERRGTIERMVSFDAVADEYDAGRPDYPEAMFDALEPLGGRLVLEGGAGTGNATRALLARGARVVPFDIGQKVLRKAVDHTPGLPAVAADGGVLPFADGCADLICYAQSWHWVDARRRWTESARVLRPDGRWAVWWSLPYADGEPWFTDYWTLLEASTIARLDERDYDTGADIRGSGVFTNETHSMVPWIREVTVEGWLLHEASKSYVAALPEPDRRSLVEEVERITREAFPDGTMRVAYQTHLWIATKI